MLYETTKKYSIPSKIQINCYLSSQVKRQEFLRDVTGNCISSLHPYRYYLGDGLLPWQQGHRSEKDRLGSWSVVLDKKAQEQRVWSRSNKGTAVSPTA